MQRSLLRFREYSIEITLERLPSGRLDRDNGLVVLKENDRTGVMVELSRDDRKQLLSLLERLPEMREERSRRLLLANAGLEDISGRLDVSGPPATAVSEIVDFLCKYGRKEREREALAFLLLETLGLVGLEQREFIVDLLAKYQMTRATKVRSPVPPPSPPPKPAPEAFPGVPLQTFSFKTLRLDEEGNIVEFRDCKARQFVEDLGNGVRLEMVEIPGGEFWMGSPDGEGNDSERPQHKVTVPSFYLGKYPVTQEQWQVVIGSNPSKFQGVKRPVEQVSWDDAVEFCRKLSLKMGRIYRLPSEAEWEYACRAGTTTPFHFGATLTAEIANYDAKNTYASGPKGEYRERTTDVGSFPPNAFGLHDMHGNVQEWCADNRYNNYEGVPVDGSAWIDKKINDSDNDKKVTKVLRGGSWVDRPSHCYSAYRCRNYPDRGYGYFGVRVACVPPRIL